MSASNKQLKFHWSADCSEISHGVRGHTRYAIIQTAHFYRWPIWYTCDYYFYVPLSLVAVFQWISYNYRWLFILMSFFFFYHFCWISQSVKRHFAVTDPAPRISKCHVFKGVSIVEYLDMILLKKRKKARDSWPSEAADCKKERKKSCCVSNKWTRWLPFLERVAAAGPKRPRLEIPAQLWGLQTPWLLLAQK